MNSVDARRHFERRIHYNQWALGERTDLSADERERLVAAKMLQVVRTLPTKRAPRTFVDRAVQADVTMCDAQVDVRPTAIEQRHAAMETEVVSKRDACMLTAIETVHRSTATEPTMTSSRSTSNVGTAMDEPQYHDASTATDQEPARDVKVELIASSSSTQTPALALVAQSSQTNKLKTVGASTSTVDVTPQSTASMTSGSFHGSKAVVSGVCSGTEPVVVVEKSTMTDGCDVSTCERACMTSQVATESRATAVRPDVTSVGTSTRHEDDVTPAVDAQSRKTSSVSEHFHLIQGTYALEPRTADVTPQRSRSASRDLEESISDIDVGSIISEVEGHVFGRRRSVARLASLAGGECSCAHG